MSKVKDTNYLAITAMLAARETKMLSAERMERMIDAPTNDEAAKILEECVCAEFKSKQIWKHYQ